MAARRKDLLLSLLRIAGDANDGRWHASLMTTLEGVDAAAARWRPAGGRPSIWALVRNVIVWKRAIMESFDYGYVDPDSSSAAVGAELPSDDAAWSKDRDELARLHRLLRQRVAAADDRLLDREVDGLDGTWIDQVMQMATYDAYLAGQVRLLTKLREAQVDTAD